MDTSPISRNILGDNADSSCDNNVIVMLSSDADMSDSTQNIPPPHTESESSSTSNSVSAPDCVVKSDSQEVEISPSGALLGRNNLNSSSESNSDSSNKSDAPTCIASLPSSNVISLNNTSANSASTADDVVAPVKESEGGLRRKLPNFSKNPYCCI